MWENGPTRSFQQPDCPLNSNVVSSLRQCPCGTVTSGALPDPIWAAFGGRAYWFTANNLSLRWRSGTPFSDEVFVSVHTTICSEVWSPPVPAFGWVASSAALELMKYSVPPAPSWNELVPGDWAGQTVKPGCVDPASLGAVTMPDVSMCCIVTLEAPAASCAFENA